MAQAEAEADALRADEEELLQAHVKLKAAVVTSQQRLRENACKPTPSVETPAATEKTRTVRASAAAQAFAARRNPHAESARCLRNKPDASTARRASSSGARPHSAAVTAATVAPQAASPST